MMGSHWQALDPLLAMMMHYDDDHDLSRKIDSLYQVLDSDQNGSLGYEELVESFKKIPVGARARARFSSSKAFCLRLFRTHADARLGVSPVLLVHFVWVALDTWCSFIQIHAWHVELQRHQHHDHHHHRDEHDAHHHTIPISNTIAANQTTRRRSRLPRMGKC